MNYKGVIIEESLVDKRVLDEITILKTRIEKVTPKHKTPWLTQWTLDTVELPEIGIDAIAQNLSNSIETTHSSWYLDFKNEKYHFIVFPHKVFKVSFENRQQYKEAREYGISIGIPSYQLQFERLKR